MYLRPLKQEDETTMTRLLTDPVIGKTFMLPDFPDREAAKPLFARMLELSRQEDRYIRGICLEDRLIGFLNDTEIRDGQIELGYVIDPAHHNRGYMTQALTLAIGQLLDMGFTRVVCGAFEENAASLHVMEKCGMQRQSYTDCVTYRGVSHQCIYYAIEKGYDHAEV